MKFADKDFSESSNVAEIIKFCEQADNKKLEKITDEIYRHQPFLISLFLGYKNDIDMMQMDEVLRVLIIIWLFFRNQINAKQIKISINRFEEKQKINIRFLKYLEGESSEQSKIQTTEMNLDNLKSKALFTAVLFKLREGKALKKLDNNISAMMTLGMKSLIECFDDIIEVN